MTMLMRCFFLCAAILVITAACSNTVTKKTNDSEKPADSDIVAADSDNPASDDPSAEEKIDTIVADEDTVRPDEDTVSKTCTKNTECTDKQYCNKPDGLCTQSGTCEIMPINCDESYEPVCGCDNKTYSNRCTAGAAGATIQYNGECTSGVSCGDNKACKDAEFCKKPDGTCTDFLAGTCETRPTNCEEISAIIYVCGCDNKTYQHPCFANNAGVNISRTGKCEESSCKTNSDCKETDFCQKETGLCDSGTGTCTLRPDACPMSGVSMPVCGCDEKQYDDLCWAHAAGVNAAFEGTCSGNPLPSKISYSYRKDPQSITALASISAMGGGIVNFKYATVVEKEKTIDKILFRVTYMTTATPAPGMETVSVQLSLPTVGGDIPYTVKLDNKNSYVRWMNAQGQLTGVLNGEVTISNYKWANDFPTYTVTELDFAADSLILGN